MRKTLPLAAAVALVFCALVLPNHPGTMKWSALNRWPLELPVILLWIAVLRWRHWITHLLAFVLTFVVVMKLADYVMFETYNRVFNFVADVYLLHPAFKLLSDSLGQVWAVLLFGLGVAGIVALFLLCLAALRRWADLDPPRPARHGLAVLAVFCTGWMVADTGHHLKAWSFEKSPPGTAWTTRLLVNRGVMTQATLTELIAIRTAMRDDPHAQTDRPLDLLQGRDVILIWLESYGRASFDNPLYSDTHMTTLKRAEAEIAGTGLHMRSGWLTAPTAGGQSWLSHSTLASGFRISDQARYAALIASGRKWLFHFAQEAGYRTSAVMPAITMEWPESDAMGFDHVFRATDIPYAGQRFRWVTMPDQFTLSVYRDLLPASTRPDFIQIALISSHAPWTPIADMVPWDQVGDGRIFDEMAARGPTPKELWDDRDDVRDAYRRSLDYVLQVIFSHAARLAADGVAKAPIVIIAGDHQSAPFVAGSENYDVPVHIIAAPDIIDLIDHWDWTDGLVPAPNGPVRRMESFRDDFIDAFTSSGNRLGFSL